ncbi:MAG TPA: ABC transporter permease, partial [Beutenbergiaceae bacterium]|nr:ABC transporter permease [Beutenbergiaceae bacterium]
MTWLTDLLDEYGQDIAGSLAETGYMLGVSLAAAVLIGLPLGMTVFLTQRGGLAENRVVWSAANLYINIVRSFPFLVFVVFLIPFTRAVMGTSFGTRAATLPLCFV